MFSTGDRLLSRLSEGAVLGNVHHIKRISEYLNSAWQLNDIKLRTHGVKGWLKLNLASLNEAVLGFSLIF